MRPRTPRTRALLLAVVLLGASACRTWQSSPLPPAGAATERVIAHARVTRVDGRVEELAEARVEGDTVRAEIYRIERGRGRVSVAVPLDSVRTLEVRRLSWGRTLGLVAGVLGTWTLFAVLISGPDALRGG